MINWLQKCFEKKCVWYVIQINHKKRDFSKVRLFYFRIISSLEFWARRRRRKYIKGGAIITSDEIINGINKYNEFI